MKYKKLGNTGLEVSTITFGCWEMGGAQWAFTDDQNNINAVRKAYDMGVTSFDTAEAYGQGHSEEVLGQALKGIPRDKIVVATKVSPRHALPDQVRDSLAGSLKRMQLDYIDLYYIHWPSFEVPFEDTMGVLLQAKEKGLIKSIGVSNFGRELLEKISAIGRIDALQPEYSLLHRGIEPAVMPWCIENNVSVMSYSSIAKGVLAGVFHFFGGKLGEDDFRSPRRLYTPEDLEKETPIVTLVRDIAEAKGITMSQVAIAWLLQKPGMTSAIVGTQNLKHLADNLGAVDVTLTDDEMARLDKVSAEVLMDIDGRLDFVAQVPTENMRKK